MVYLSESLKNIYFEIGKNNIEKLQNLWKVLADKLRTTRLLPVKLGKIISSILVQYSTQVCVSEFMVTVRKQDYHVCIIYMKFKKVLRNLEINVNVVNAKLKTLVSNYQNFVG